MRVFEFPTGRVDASVFALLETSYSLIIPAPVATAKKHPQRDSRIGSPSALVNARALLNPPCRPDVTQVSVLERPYFGAEHSVPTVVEPVAHPKTSSQVIKLTSMEE